MACKIREITKMLELLDLKNRLHQPNPTKSNKLVYLIFPNKHIVRLLIRLFSKFCFHIHTFVLSIIPDQYQPSSCLNSCATASGTATPALPCAPLTQYSWRGTLWLISNGSCKLKKETLLCRNLSQVPGCSSIRDWIHGT